MQDDEVLLHQLYATFARFQQAEIQGEEDSCHSTLQQMLREGTDEIWRRLRQQGASEESHCPTALQIELLIAALTVSRYAGIDPEYVQSAQGYEWANHWVNRHLLLSSPAVSEAVGLRLVHLVLYDEMYIDEADAERWQNWSEEVQYRWVEESEQVSLFLRLLRLQSMQSGDWAGSSWMEEETDALQRLMKPLWQQAVPDAASLPLVALWYAVLPASGWEPDRRRAEELCCVAWMKQQFPLCTGGHRAWAERILTEEACTAALTAQQDYLMGQ